MKELYFELMVYAALVSGYPMPNTLPDVYIVEQEFFNETYCRGLQKCTVVGWYVDELNSKQYGQVKHQDIYINKRAEEISKEFVDSVIVHEFVHFLQDQAGLTKRNPDNMNEFTLEIKAYYVQNQYLKKHGAIKTVCNNLAMCVSWIGEIK